MPGETWYSLTARERPWKDTRKRRTSDKDAMIKACYLGLFWEHTAAQDPIRE